MIACILMGFATNDVTYVRYKRIADYEQRCAPIGNEAADEVDMRSYTEMPARYAAVTFEYAQSVITSLRIQPIKRRRFYHEELEEMKTRVDPFPDAINLVKDRDIIVPFSVYPRPHVVRKWVAAAKWTHGGVYQENGVNSLHKIIYGRTVYFRRGSMSSFPHEVPAPPFGSFIPSWDLYLTGYDSGYFLNMGKVVVTPKYKFSSGQLEDSLERLRLGGKPGATLLGEIITTPVSVKNQRLRWVSVENEGSTRTFLAYSLLDGNGPKRDRHSVQGGVAGLVSPYMRPLTCKAYQPRINQHAELLLPTPMVWASTKRESDSLDIDGYAHEEWCMDEWFPAQPDACWVLREAEDSMALQESFLLMPASEKSDRPIFFIALFAETEPERLVKELAALHNVSPDPVLNSPETMARLTELYEKLRDFRFDK